MSENNRECPVIQIQWCKSCLAYTFHVEMSAGGWTCLLCRLRETRQGLSQYQKTLRERDGRN